ncbi:PREDICTED: uncharacterized protein LOC109184595 [Ipomoea nil]|uniref:uncharacterized protein LOC109184595 n=1 Tax=Ipomoea nil TaxID=35883 RepID=UPI000901B534|nr:PREDICTED: uncharacterized protein LOC109184595 [Ipomoea nil]
MNLLNKRVGIEPYFAICGVVHEDTMHALVLCDFAKAVWGQANLSIPVIQSNIFYEWFNAILDILDTGGLMYAAAILYHIWTARNNAVWDAYLLMPKKIMMTAVSALQAWRAVHHSAERTAAPSLADTPLAAAEHHGAPLPGQSTRRCYVDASYHHSTNTAAVGAIILDGSGGYISAYTSTLPNCFSSLMTEAFACKKDLSWLKDRGENSVELHTDCLTVKQYLTTTACPDRTYIGYAIDSCRDLISTSHSCLVVFVPRLENYLAHALATSVISQSTAMY